MNLMLNDAILGKPFNQWPLGTMLGLLVRAGKDDAHAVVHPTNGPPFEAGGEAVEVSALFSDPDLRKKGRCPVCRKLLQRVLPAYPQKTSARARRPSDHLFMEHSHAMESLPLLEVLRRIKKGWHLEQLAASEDSLCVHAVARLGDLVVGLTDSRGLLAAAWSAPTHFRAPSKPTAGRSRGKAKTQKPQRDWTGARVALNSRAIANPKPDEERWAAEELRTIAAETIVLDLDSQEGLTKHTRRVPEGRTDIHWHGWKVLRGTAVVADHLPRWPSNMDEDVLLNRAKEIDAWPDRDPLTLRPSRQPPIHSTSIDTEEALRRLLDIDEMKILGWKVQDLASKDIAELLGPAFTGSKVDKKWQTMKTRLRKAQRAGFRLPG